MKRFILYIVLLISVLSCDNSRKELEVIDVKSSYTSVENSQQIPPDTVFTKIISTYKKGIDTIMNDIVAISNNVFYRHKPSGSLDNLVTDAMVAEVNNKVDLKVDFAMYNYYGLRMPLPKGEITLGNVYELLPFSNELTFVHLSPSGMQGLIKYIYVNNGMPLSGMSISYNDSLNYEAKINGEIIDTTSYYWVVTSDYSANGGDKMDFFKQSDSVYYTGILIRDALLHYFKNIKENNLELKADSMPRIYFNN